MKQGLCLFGGSFNPPHRSHRRIIEAALAQLPVERCIVLPTGLHPLKVDPEMTPAEQRLQLCELAFGDMPGVEVSDLEQQRSGPSYTVDSLRHFHALDPQRPLYWVIGSDNLGILDQWRDLASIKTLATLVVFPRLGFAAAEPSLQGLQLLQMPADAVSSTEIRATLRRGEESPDLQPEVRQRIRELGMYSP